MKWSEENILYGLKKGDRHVFELVFKSYYPVLCTFANDYVRSFSTAEEIVQEVFLHLWDSRERLQIHTSVKAYLFRSVHNYCLNFLRDKRNKKGSIFQIDSSLMESELLSFEMPEFWFDTAFSKQVEKEFEKAVKSLPEQCRTIFLMARNENLSYPEISKKLNVSLSTVKTQMSRAMEKLSEWMLRFL